MRISSWCYEWKCILSLFHLSLIYNVAGYIIMLYIYVDHSQDNSMWRVRLCIQIETLSQPEFSLTAHRSPGARTRNLTMCLCGRHGVKIFHFCLKPFTLCFTWNYIITENFCDENTNHLRRVKKRSIKVSWEYQGQDFPLFQWS